MKDHNLYEPSSRLSKELHDLIGASLWELSSVFSDSDVSF